MPNLVADLFVAVIGGVLTSAFLFLLSSIWTRSLYPWILQTRYRGVLIEGTWFGSGTATPEQIANGERWNSEIYLILEQSATALKGSFRSVYRSPTNSFDIEYRAEGQIWEGYVVLNLIPRDRTKTAIASAMLKIAGGGVGLVGKFSFRNVNSESVDSIPIMLGRGGPVPIVGALDPPVAVPAARPIAIDQPN